MKIRLFLLTLVLSLPLVVKAQTGTIAGMVNDVSSGAALAGANVVVEGTNLGAAADDGGSYLIENVPAGSHTVTASVIGYKSSSESVTIGRGTAVVNFSLTAGVLKMSALEVLASRADEKTPVAYTTVTKADMEFRLGSQDIPMSLNTTPSVYATHQGGGAGDARINVRGFNQRNVAVMINGVPQNDMENGWVYWSNWDGVGDATSSIQMQRGLSAVNLATPSIGGTMNILTDPTAHERGGRVKQEIGAGNFLKTTINLNTGLINDNMAFSATIVRKTGDGVIDKTWTDAWAYYFGASYQMNDANRLELYAVGAPQRHGQNLYKQNAGVYDAEFAEGMDGYDPEAIWNGLGYPDSEGEFTSPYDGGDPRLFNQNWAPINSSYKGKQYWYMYGANTVERHDPNYLNERENFFHKPLVNLNHFLTISDNMRLSSIFYWSGGSGGGTGTYGKIPTMDAAGALGDDGHKFYYGPSPWTRDWNALVAMNSGGDDTVYVDKSALVRTHGSGNNQSVGILRNSINRQSTIGLISKLNFDMSDALGLQVGLDWRSAGIEHAREVRDLMGGDYYVDFADDNFSSGKEVGLGDIIAYHNETTVDWLGFFGQANYASGPISAYGMAGMSSITYTYQDHFTVADALISADPISAIQFKGGAMFDVSDNISVWSNFGISEKPPIMDNVIYFDGTVASDPANEKFQSLEAGVNYHAGNFAVKTNYYMTDWIDRNLTKAVTTGQGSSGDTDVIFLTGVNQNHSGLELEASMQVIDMLRLDAAAGLGTWKFVDDATGKYQEYTETGTEQTTYTYALKDLFVGDMPQTTMALGMTLNPIAGLSVQALFNYYDKNYSDWSPDAREVDSDGTADDEQVWMAPSYNKLDLHINYDLPVSIAGTKMTVFAHVFNALDAVYVQDATDNSQYNAYGSNEGDENGKMHKADDAEVFLGIPRYFNAGLKINF